MTVSSIQLGVAGLIIAIGVVVIARFELDCLEDLACRKDYQLRYLSRRGWTALILLAMPVSGIVYLRFGRSI